MEGNAVNDAGVSGGEAVGTPVPPGDTTHRFDASLEILGEKVASLDGAAADAAVSAVADPLRALAAYEPEMLALVAEGEKLQEKLSRLVVPRTYVYLIAGTILITGSAAVIMGNPSLQLWYFIGVAVLFVAFVAIYLKQAAKFSRLSRPTQDSLARATVEMATLVRAIDAEEAKLADAEFEFSTDTYQPVAGAIAALSEVAFTARERVARARAALKKN